MHHFWWAIPLLSGCADVVDRSPEIVRPADYSDPVVLLVSPDSGEIRRLHQELGDDFYVTTDDAMWYRAEAFALLDSLRIPHAEVGRGVARFLVDGQPKLVSWAEVPQPWFAVVYDGNAVPRLSADVDLGVVMATFPRQMPE